jgi:DNA-binding XRE family transcriptional regulator
VTEAETPHPLARWRAFHRLSQEALSEDSGVARITIARIEGGSDPHVSTALRLAHALGVTVKDIWTYDGEPSAALLAAERRTRRRG